MNENKEWFVIVNPEANSGAAKHIWPKIDELLQTKNILFKSIFTRYKMESIEIVKKAVYEGWRNFIAVGGDGTINEVINGVFLQDIVEASKITFAMIPLGTGNDWGRSIGITQDYNRTIDLIVAGKTIMHDAGIVEYHALNMMKKRFLINVAGVGFDAAVVVSANEMKDCGKNGKLYYLKTIFAEIFRYKSQVATIIADGEVVYCGKLFSCCVGLGKYNGGGLMQVPHAVNNEGKFAVTIVKDISAPKFIVSFIKLLKGKMLHIKEVEGIKAQEVSIESEIPVGVEVDGEYLGLSNVKFTVLKNAVRIIVE